MNTRIHGPFQLGPAFSLFACAALCRVLVSLVDVFQATKVVQPAEFAAGALLFNAYPTLKTALWIFAGANTLLLCVLGLRARSLPGSTGCLFLLAAATQLLAVVDIRGTFATGLMLLILFFQSELSRMRSSPHLNKLDRGRRLTGSFTFTSVLNKLPGITLWSLIGLILFGAAEAWFSTSRHLGNLFDLEDFTDFLFLAGAGCVLTSFRWAVEVAFVVLTISFFSNTDVPRWKRFLIAGITFGMTPSSWTSGWELPTSLLLLVFFDWWCDRDKSALRRFFAPAVVLGLFTGIRLQNYFFGVLIDEISALGLTAPTYGALVPCAVLLCVWTHTGRRALFEFHAPANRREAGAAVATAALVPFLSFLAGFLARNTGTLRLLLRRTTIPAVTLLAAATIVLVKLNYPVLSDFSQVAQPMWATLLGLCAALLFLLVQSGWMARPPFSGPIAWTCQIALVTVAFFTWHQLSPRQGPRLVIAQYAKILRQMLEGVRIVPKPTYPSLTRDTAISGDLHGLFSTGNYPVVDGLEFYKTRRPPMFVLIWDAARPDHMSAYGYERPNTPHAAKLASEGVLFERAYANATATTTSMRKMFSGRYSSRHMLAKSHDPFFTGELVSKGYDRIWINIDGSDYNGVSAEAFLRNQPDKDAVVEATRSFQAYEEFHKTRRTIEILDRELAERANRKHPGDGLFFYLHCAAMHFPWRYWKDHQDYGREPTDLYDNSIGHADNALGMLVKALKMRGLYDDAIIVLTADHGTGLGEHGKYGGFQPYEEQIRVPLIIKAPGFAPRRVGSPVALIDIAPTFVSLFEPDGQNTYHGWSLLELMTGRTNRLPRRYLASFCAFEDAMALLDFDEEWKLQLHRSEGYRQLYDLTNDPKERRNRADHETMRLESMSRVAGEFLRAGLESYANPYHYRSWNPPD